MKYLLSILLFLSLSAHAQIDSYLSTTGLFNATTNRPMLSINMDFVSNKFIYRSSIVSPLDSYNQGFLQQKFGYHKNNWSILAGPSLHVDPVYGSSRYSNSWAIVTEMRYTQYLLNRFWGFTLQQDGKFVLFGIEIGGKF